MGPILPNNDKRQQIGRLGEDIAATYLKNKGFQVIGRNFRKKCGEIDLIAKNGETLHFIEVKSVSRENFNQNVSRVTDGHRAEDNVHPSKLKRLARTIQVYLMEKFPSSEPAWEFHVIVVEINTTMRRARVTFLKDIIL